MEALDRCAWTRAPKRWMTRSPDRSGWNPMDSMDDNRKLVLAERGSGPSDFSQWGDSQTCSHNYSYYPLAGSNGESYVCRSGDAECAPSSRSERMSRSPTLIVMPRIPQLLYHSLRCLSKFRNLASRARCR